MTRKVRIAGRFDWKTLIRRFAVTEVMAVKLAGGAFAQSRIGDACSRCRAVPALARNTLNW